MHPSSTCQASEASLEAAKLAMRAVLTGAEELKQVSCGDDELEVGTVDNTSSNGGF